MQCPFLIECGKPLCETGAFGIIKPTSADYKNHCVNRTYYHCKVYKANTGTGTIDPQKCAAEITARKVKY